MAEAPRDQNHVPTMLLESSTTSGVTLSAKGDEITGRLLVDGASVALNTIIPITGGTTTLTTAQNQSTSIEVTGILTSNATIIVADTMAPFVFENLTTGAYTVTVKTLAGTGVVVAQGVTVMLYANGTNVEVTATGGAGAGTVTSVSVVTANGISGTVATATTTPAITLTLGVITPTSVNGLTLVAAATGFTIAGGTTSKTLTVPLDASVSGTNTGDQTTISGNAGSATAIGITDDTTTNATMYPVWVTANTGNLPAKVTSTKLSFNPSTGALRTSTLQVGTGADNSAIVDVHQSGNTIPMIQAQDSGVSSSSSGGIFQATLDNGAYPASGTRIGGYQYSADGGDSVKRIGAAINALTTELWTSTANGTQLKFNVTANTTATRVTALTLDQDKTATFGGTVALGTNSLTMTGSLAATGARVTKGWFTDIESTNMPTVGGTAILTSLTAPQFTTIELGAASDTTLSRVSAGVIAVEGSTVPTLSVANTFTATQSFNQILDVVNSITASGNAATVPITYRNNKVTNNSAATLTITMTTTSAVDGQLSLVRILDASAVAQTITWVNTEDSTVTAPTTSNGSTTLPLTVGFQFNGATSKWRTIAKA